MKTFPRILHRISQLRWRVIRPITVGVRLILEREESVLLVRHTYGRPWYLPGGGVKKGEMIEAAARREAREELGAELGGLSLQGIYSSFLEYKSDHVVVFSCREFTLTGKMDREVECFEFFRLCGLPEEASPGTLRRIREYMNRSGSPIVGKW